MPERAPIFPIRDNVLIKPDEAKTQSESGFYFSTPQSEDKGLRRGTIIAVGPGVELDGKQIRVRHKVGERVLYTKYGPTEFEFNKEKYVLCPQYDIVAVFDGS
jgi:chaperonin GroES